MIFKSIKMYVIEILKKHKHSTILEKRFQTFSSFVIILADCIDSILFSSSSSVSIKHFVSSSFNIKSLPKRKLRTKDASEETHLGEDVVKASNLRKRTVKSRLNTHITNEF